MYLLLAGVAITVPHGDTQRDLYVTSGGGVAGGINDKTAISLYMKGVYIILDTVIRILLSILIILQIICIGYQIYSIRKRHIEDKKFWAEMDEAVKEQIARYNELYPEEPLQLEDTDDEQDE